MTIQVQAAGACTTSVCAPMLDCDVTDCPDGPVSLIAAVPLGDDPAGVTNTWNDGPAAGAGEHLNAQPMFHEATVVVKGVLVQLPVSCGDIRRTRAGPAAAVDDAVVDPPATVVVVDPPAAVVVVDPPEAVVVVAELPPAAVVVVAVLPGAGEPEDAALGGGSLPLSPLAAPFALDPPPVSPLIHMPTMVATRMAAKSCQVLQDRRSLSLSSPGWGVSSDDADGASPLSEVDVTGPASNTGPVGSSEPRLNASRDSRVHQPVRDHVQSGRDAVRPGVDSG